MFKKAIPRILPEIIIINVFFRHWKQLHHKTLEENVDETSNIELENIEELISIKKVFLISD